MVNNVDYYNIYNYSDEEYRRKNQRKAITGFIAASAAAAGIKSFLPAFSKPFLKQMPKEHLNNYLYKDAFEKSIDLSGLKDKGLEYIDVSKVLLLPPDPEVQKGLNAFYSPENKKIVLNGEKATISGFHELGHAMNYLNGGFGNFLRMLKKPGMWLAGIMSTVAFFSSAKKEGEQQNILDKIAANSGPITFCAMMPVVAEEALASHKGIKIARRAGLSEPLIKNLKKFYGKALLTYGGYALIVGLSAYAASKVMRMFTRSQ